MVRLVSNLSLGCKTFLENPFLFMYHLGNFDHLIQSGFWVIPKITFAHLCKPIHNIIIPVLCDPLNVKTGKEGGKIQKNWISQEWKKAFYVK